MLIKLLEYSIYDNNGKSFDVLLDIFKYRKTHNSIS